MAAAEGPIASRVFVGNLAWATDDAALAEHLGAAGSVTSATVLRYSDSGRSKGSGLVDFATAEEAARAVEELTDSELNGRQIFVRADRGPVPESERRPRRTERAPREPRAPRGGAAGGGRSEASSAPRTPFGPAGEPGTGAYVGNLAWATTDESLLAYFGDFKPTGAEIKMRNGRSSGWGVVRFGSVEDCTAAIAELNETSVDGRSINVREFRED